MKILLTAKGIDLNAQTDKRFGRAEYFLLIDGNNGEILEAIKNPNLNEEHGVGIKTATFALEQNVDIIISGSYGPKAYDVLKNGNAKLFILEGDTVKEALDNFKNNTLKEFKN